MNRDMYTLGDCRTRLSDVYYVTGNWVFAVPAGMKKSILIVDDDELLSGLLQDYLEADGHEVSCCYNGHDAILLSKELNFDVILADYHIPGLNGAEVAATIRSRFANSFIVGCSPKLMKNTFLAAGADAFVQKPFNFRELASLIRRHTNDIQ